MKLPPFQDFFNTFTSEKLQEIVDDINEEKMTFYSGKINTEQISENLNNIVFLSLVISEGLLESYHEWLTEQLDK